MRRIEAQGESEIVVRPAPVRNWPPTSHEGDFAQDLRNKYTEIINFV